MTTSNDIASVGIFEGPESIEIVRIRRNKDTGLLEYKHSGFFTKWHPIHGKGIPLSQVSKEKILKEDGVETKIRAVRFKQSINGNVCHEDVNPRVMSQFDNMQTEVTRLKRLCRAYYDILYNMVGEDSLKEMMKQKFKAVKEIKAEGSSGMDFDPYNRGGVGYRPLGLMGRPPLP